MAVRVFNSQLQTATLLLLRQRPSELTIKKISEDTGLGVPWLERFARSIGGNSSVDRVEQLYTYLSGKKLEV